MRCRDGPSQESETAGILYFTRLYRLRPGRSEPQREGNPPFGGDLGYLKFGVFPGDNRCFSVTMCTPEIEYELRKAIVRSEMWDVMVENLPGLRVWCDAGGRTLAWKTWPLPAWLPVA